MNRASLRRAPWALFVLGAVGLALAGGSCGARSGLARPASDDDGADETDDGRDDDDDGRDDDDDGRDDDDDGRDDDDDGRDDDDDGRDDDDDDDDGSSFVCGNGIVEPGEACDGGTVGPPRPLASVLQDDLKTPLTPFRTRNATASQVYDFRSASAHTGFEALDQGNVFLHLGPAGELSLFTLHGIDFDEDGIAQGDGRVTQTFDGLPDSAFVLLSDDTPEEFDFAGPSLVFGDWTFGNNTDGGIIGGLPWPGDYVIEVGTDLQVGITSFGALDPANGRRVLTEDTAFIVVETVAPECRADCTIPACGDQIVDLGEACDDGNLVDGDGCAADCLGP